MTADLSVEDGLKAMDSTIYYHKEFIISAHDHTEG
jgi:hypothetical protein